jgi:hypothetical protein
VKNQRIAARFLPKRSTIAIALALSLGTMGADVYAFGFGEPEISSALGQPLRMRVPLQPDPTVDLSPQCLRLLGSERDPLPTLTTARLSIEENGKDRVLRIDSLNPINEPILRIIVEAGCAQHVRREFTVLLDPPVPSLPATALGPTVGVASLSPSGESNVAPPNATIATEVGSPLALDLGVARILGRMGEPLRMQIPITGTAAPTLDNSSVRVARVLNSDGTPLHGQAQISMTRSDTSTTLQLVTDEPIAEPALRVVVEVATPSTSVRREYGVLLDLPAGAAKAPASTESTEPAMGAAPEPLPEAAATALAQNAKTAPAQAEAPAAEAAPPPPPKPRKRPVHRTPKPAVAENLAAAPLNATPPEPAHAPSNSPAKAEEKLAPMAAAAPNAVPERTGAADHLVLTSPDSQAQAAAKRFAEMDQRVKDLTDEIVRLRADLATQKLHEAQLVQREAELAAQGSRPGGNWVWAIGGALAASLAAFLLWTRRRAGAPLFNPNSWEDANHTRGGESPATQGPDFLVRPGSVEIPPNPAAPGGALASSTAANAAKEQPFRTERKGNTVPGQDPITISHLTTPIEVTEVLSSEPSIEQLYTLFYDIGGNSIPGSIPTPGGKTPGAVLPPATMPQRDNLDIDLGIPESIQSNRAARAQGAMKQAPAIPPMPASPLPGSQLSSAPTSRSFTYEDKPAAALVPDPSTNVGPLTEMPRDAEFPHTQPGLDLDLTTNIAAPTQPGALSLAPREDNVAQPSAPAPLTPPPRPAGARNPGGLELDLTTDIGPGTELGPMTVMPKDDDDPKTRVELDLDLNTNLHPLHSTEENQDRESDPFAITTIPGSWSKNTKKK